MSQDEDEIHLWCSKRPTLSAEEYCHCDVCQDCEKCARYVLNWEKIFKMDGTEGRLAMTDLLWSGDTGWKDLWEERKMSVVAGVGREDHFRSHFLVKDAAAKGVSVPKEESTSNGWLSKSIFAYNNLYCKPNENPCPSPASEPKMVDGISLAQAAAGPHALEVSRQIAATQTFTHLTGVQNVDDALDSVGNQYKNPFLQMMSGMEDSMVGRRSSLNKDDFRDDMVRQQSVRLREQTDADEWAATKTNLGLSELLEKEAALFAALGVLTEKLSEYKHKLPTVCPCVGGAEMNADGRQVCWRETDDSPLSSFPSAHVWSDSDSDAEIGMQLRAVAMLIANGVTPKVFQVQQKRYDTHAGQGPNVRTLLADLKTGVYTFVKAADSCGFWEKVLVTTFTDFGRRLEENSRRGTDHGWSTYNAGMYFLSASTYVSVCVHVREVCVCVRACERLCAFVCVHECVHLHTHTCTHSLTHSHTHSLSVSLSLTSFRSQSQKTCLWLQRGERLLRVGGHHP